MDATSFLAGYEGLVGDTPLCRLKRVVTRPDVEVIAKLEGGNLGGSVKDRAALGMINAAEGELAGRRIVEATSGNTGIALAMIAALKGLPITLILPANATRERRVNMEAYGAEVLIADDMIAARDWARSLADAGTHHELDQFSNPANPLMHYLTTGPEVLRQTAGRITHFVSSMGTTGTIMGTARYLAEAKPSVRIVGVHPEEGSQIPGIRKWPDAYRPRIHEDGRIHEMRYVNTDDATRTTRQLARDEGLFVGLSGGGACTAALRVAEEAPAGSVIVFVVPDRGDKYLSMETLFGP
ncbi:MAG: pyridoxal-phosphate dependent enzyme [bacterium]